MAVTLDKLGFSELILASGTPLDGVSIDNLTMMLVPESKSKNFNAEDKSIPKHIQDNILKVLKMLRKILWTGINLFSELDFQASGDMKDFMSLLEWTLN